MNGTVPQLENAQQAATKNSDHASSVREELAGTRTRLESQSSELGHLQRQVLRHATGVKSQGCLSHKPVSRGM